MKTSDHIHPVMNEVLATIGQKPTVCPDCARLYDALMIVLEDEEKRLKRRLRHMNDPKTMTDEQLKVYYKNQIKSIVDRKVRIKEQFGSIL